VLAVSTTPVDVFVRTTSAPGTTAPDASATVPCIEELPLCALNELEFIKGSTRASTNSRFLKFIRSSNQIALHSIQRAMGGMKKFVSFVSPGSM
jgi:hypothetical protein